MAVILWYTLFEVSVMCGRYYFDIYEKALEEIIKELERNLYCDFKTGEIYPTDIAPIVTKQGVTPAKWGFPKQSHKGVIINARAESLSDKYMFKGLVNSNRCIIPASGFFEWERNDSGAKNKDKYYFKRPGSALYMAGLFNSFHDKTKQLSLFDDTENEQLSYVIITKDANECMAGIHDRMPLIFSEHEMQYWLKGGSMQDLLKSNNAVLEHSIF